MLQPRSSTLLRTLIKSSSPPSRWLAQKRAFSQQVSGATGKELPMLTPISTWPKKYPSTHMQGTGHRSYISNEDTAAKLMQSYNLDDGGEPKTVIEAYPGPGLITRQLLTLPRSVMDKLIILEYSPFFHPELYALAAVDDRVHIVKESAFYWTVYEDLQREGHMKNIPTVGFDQVHPKLRMVGQLPRYVLIEQWVSQIMRAVADRSWIWAYGRIPIDLVMIDKLYSRVMATNRNHPKARCKLSIITQANVDVKDTLGPEELTPYANHFFPAKHGPTSGSDPFVYRAINIVPKVQPYILQDCVDEWDFVLRNLYVNKGKALGPSLTFLAPGAANLLPKLIDESLPMDQRVDAAKKVRDLSPQDWANVVRVFKEWPFKPPVLKATTALEHSLQEAGKPRR